MNNPLFNDNIPRKYENPKNVLIEKLKKIELTKEQVDKISKIIDNPK